MNGTPTTPPAARQQDATDNSVIRHGFSVGQLHLLIPSGIPVQLLDVPRISPLPLAPPWCKGMANHRGDVIAVFSVPELLLPPAPQTTAKHPHWLLVIDSPPNMCGLLIDSYPQLLNALQEADLDSVANIPEQIWPFVYAAYTGSGKTWLDCRYDAWLLSVKALFQDYQSSLLS